jgi:putative acetyltransferase
MTSELVSPVQVKDFPRILEVWEASVRATHDFISEADIQFFKPLVQGVLPQMPVLTCVRDNQRQVIGFLGLEGEKVEMLFIDPQWRNQGIGRRLLRQAIQVHGAKTLDVNEQNPQAVGFYLNLGFEVVGRSETDGIGKPFPLLHMRLGGTGVEVNQKLGST